MRCQQKKRPYPKPMKSPSPDNVRKNIIQHTEPPLDDVRNYIHKSQIKSPRIPSSSFNGANTSRENLDAYVKRLQSQLAEMQHLKHKCTQLIEENVRMHSQINYLQSKVNIQTTTTHFQHRMPSRFQDNQSILKEFNERVTRLAEEKKHLTDQLQTQNCINQQVRGQNLTLKSNNQILESEKFYLRSHLQKLSEGRYSQPDFQSYRRQIQEYMQRRFRECQEQLQRRMRDPQLKIDRVKYLQGILQQQRSSKMTMSTPQNYKEEYLYTQRSTANKRINQSREVQSFNHDSPILDENNKLKNQINHLKRTIDTLQSQLQQSRNICQHYQQSRQSETKRIQKSYTTQQRYHSTPIQNTDEESNKMLQNKILQLRLNLDMVTASKDNKEAEVQSLRRKLIEASEYLQKQKRDYQQSQYKARNQLQNSQMKYKQLQEKYTKLQKGSAESSGKVLVMQELQRQMEESTRQLQKAQEESRTIANQRDRMKVQYEVQLQKKEQMLSNLVGSYLDILRQVKTALSGQEIEDLLSEMNNIFSEKVTLSSQLEIVSESMDLIIAELKKRILLQEDHIIELEKNIKIIDEEKNQLVIQKDKLKQAIHNFTLPAQSGLKNVQKVDYTHQVSEQSCKLKTCLRDTTSKIDQLQQQMKQLLKE